MNSDAVSLLFCVSVHFVFRVPGPADEDRRRSLQHACWGRNRARGGHQQAEVRRKSKLLLNNNWLFALSHQERPGRCYYPGDNIATKEVEKLPWYQGALCMRAQPGHYGRRLFKNTYTDIKMKGSSMI